ncbi:MAG: alpha/beta hydrolase [Bacteroidetes bacterium]|nr:alpha/beta hydrolase [Bacteroidota bacterium]
MKRSITLIILMLFAGCSGGYVYQQAPALEFSELEYGFASRSAVVNGIRVSYMDEGSGTQTLVLVHGLASNGGFWRYNIPELSKYYRVIAVDLPGYGKSAKGVYPYTMSFYADVVSGLIKELGIGKVTYIGHSMGGQIGIHFSFRHLEQLERLILAAPAGLEPFSRGDGDWLKSVMTIDFVKKTPEDRIRANLALNFYNYSDAYEWMVEERTRMAKAADFEDFCYAVVRSVHGMLDEPTTKRLPQIRVPTHLIFGENDGLIPNPILHGGAAKDVAKIGTDAIPGVTLDLIPSAGHMLQIEQPEAFNALVRKIVQ